MTELAAPPRTAVRAELIQSEAWRIADILRVTNIDDDAFGNVWGVAALCHLGMLSESQVATAAFGAKLNGRDVRAYFYRCLDNELRENEGKTSGLLAMLRTIRFDPVWPKHNPDKPIGELLSLPQRVNQ